MTKRALPFALVAPLILAGCIDISEPVLDPTYNFQSTVRFANLADSAVSVSISDVNESFGSIAPGEATTYRVLNSGSRSVELDFFGIESDTSFSQSFSTDRRSTAFILGPLSEPTLVNAVERYEFKPDCCDGDSANVRLINGLAGYEKLVSVSVDAADSAAANLTEESAMPFGDYTSYIAAAPGSYVVTVAPDSTTSFSSDTLAIAANTRYTIAIHGANFITLFSDED